ncbi:hypothetical protein FRB99_005431 [Tulasnella sp. 403]|nr:hypothetical protein FRB99_005431 [Tulasnella sp. 403]
MTIRFLLSLFFFTAATIAQVNIVYPSNTPPGAFYVQDNFFGISFEMQVINTLIGNTPDTIPIPIQKYVVNIRNRLSNPIRLRVGGNSMDSSRYVPAQVPMINGTVDNVNYTATVTYGPALIDTITRLGDIVGGALWNVGLSLIHVEDVNNTVALALYAKQTLGDRLDAYQLGNEPDLYLSHNWRAGAINYTLQNYIDDYANVLGQMHSNPALVNAPMSGPATCCFWDFNTVLTNGYLGAFRQFLKYVTLQHYPQNNCVGAPPQYPLDYYLQHSNVVGLATWSLPGVITAQNSGVNVSMAEFNSVSCGGIPGISNTFGAAMWAIDYALQLASLGYQSAYIHTREAGIPYNLFSPPLPTLDQNSPGWTTGPPYHSLLVVAEALHAPDVPTMAVVDLGLPSPSNTVAAYAIYPSPTPSIARMPPLRLVLFNYAQNGSTTFQFVQNNTGIDHTTGRKVTIGDVAVKYLQASSVVAAVNITWAGQLVDGGGNLQGSPTNTTITDCGSSDGCSITLPGPSVAIVFFDGISITSDSTTTLSPTQTFIPIPVNVTTTYNFTSTPTSFDPGYLNGSNACKLTKEANLSVLLFTVVLVTTQLLV